MKAYVAEMSRITVNRYASAPVTTYWPQLAIIRDQLPWYSELKWSSQLSFSSRLSSEIWRHIWHSSHNNSAGTRLLWHVLEHVRWKFRGESWVKWCLRRPFRRLLWRVLWLERNATCYRPGPSPPHNGSFTICFCCTVHCTQLVKELTGHRPHLHLTGHLYAYNSFTRNHSNWPPTAVLACERTHSAGVAFP